MDEIEAPQQQPPPAIQFEIGGQVKTSASRLLVEPFQFAGSITSLDLDDVQPPSEMDGISYSNYNMMGSGGKLTDSPQMSSMRNRKSGLPSTLVARRAIAGPNSVTTGHSLLMRSVESVASHTNLENVAPPSLMDELLDSMMSVDSITSEVASDPLARTLCAGVEVSHYETALSDNEDTMTLRSCRELPLDGNGSSSNCSSNQSTPARKRPGSITPKMKREMARERFKTYTVNGSGEQVVAGGEGGGIGGDGHRDAEERNEGQIQVVPTAKRAVPGDSPSPEKANGGVLRMSAKQRRQENRSRFQTQILDYTEMKIFEIAPTGEQLREEENAETEEEKEEQQQQQQQQQQENEQDVDVTMDPELSVPEEKKKKATVIKKTLLRLIKPVASVSPAEDTNKGIRGRRKPDYVSPYRRPGGTPTSAAVISTVNSVNNNTPKGGKSLIGTPGQRRSLPATGFISKLKQVATKKSPTKSVVANGTAGKNKDESPKELNRQGTFTKEEPSSVNLPKVNSLPATPTKTVTSKLPPVGGSGARKTYGGGGGGGFGIPTASSAAAAVTNGGSPRNGGVIKRQISAPAAGNLLGEKRKSMIASPYAGSKASPGGGQLMSERSTSNVSIRSNGSAATKMTPSRAGGQEKKLPLSMPASRSNSTMGTPRTPTTPNGTASKMSLYGRAKGFIPVTSSAKK